MFLSFKLENNKYLYNLCISTLSGLHLATYFVAWGTVEGSKNWKYRKSQIIRNLIAAYFRRINLKNYGWTLKY